MLSQATVRGLGRQVKALLLADCLWHVSNTALEIKGSLTVEEFVEVWHQLKRWYQSAEDRAPKACPEMLALQTAERAELYTAVPLLG